MFIKRAPWALPILLALAGCGGSSLTTPPRAPDVPAVATGHIAYVQEGQIIPEDFGRTATDIFIPYLGLIPRSLLRKDVRIATL